MTLMCYIRTGPPKSNSQL